jgi:hypothetical protein
MRRKASGGWPGAIGSSDSAPQRPADNGRHARNPFPCSTDCSAGRSVVIARTACCTPHGTWRPRSSFGNPAKPADEPGNLLRRYWPAEQITLHFGASFSPQHRELLLCFHAFRGGRQREAVARPRNTPHDGCIPWPRKRKTFRASFDFDGVLAEDREIHVIPDHYSTPQRNDDRLAKFGGRVRFHFTSRRLPPDGGTGLKSFTVCCNAKHSAEPVSKPKISCPGNLRPSPKAQRARQTVPLAEARG